MSEWISVKERLPQEGQKIIVRLFNIQTKGYRACSSAFELYEDHVDGFAYATGETKIRFNLHADPIPYEAVTHWMLFPELPAPSEDEV